MNALTINDNIKDYICIIRNMQVMLDGDLAEYYGVKTWALKQVIKRNVEKFPNQTQSFAKLRYHSDIDQNQITII